MKNKPTDYEIQFPTLLASYEIANELEGELQKELLPLYAKAKKAFVKELQRLQDLPPSTSLYSKAVQDILDDATKAFRKEWNVPAFKALSVYTKTARTLGDMTAEVLFENIARLERRE